MRILSSVLLSLICISMLGSCRQSKHKGFEKTDSGLFYQFFTRSNSGKKAKHGEVLYTRMSLSVMRPEGDTLLFNSQMFPDFGRDIKFIMLDSNSFVGDIMEGLEMMEIGDSAAFIISADSFFIKANRMDSLPDGFKPGQELIFHIGLTDIQTEAETRKRLEAMRTKENSDRMAIADKAREEEPALIAEYIERKKITEKPTASGIYLISSLPGNGAKP